MQKLSDALLAKGKTTEKKWTDDVLMELLHAHRSGVRKCDLAKQIGVTGTRIGQLINRAVRVEMRNGGQ